MTKYLLLFRDSGQNQTEEEVKAWDAYIGRIAREGKFVSGLPFGPGAKIVAGIDKAVTDFYQKPGDITGYVIIRVNSLDEAVETAKQAPSLLSGGSVEVRSTIPPVQ